MRITAGLIRVSTREQVESGLVQQEGRLRDAGAERIYVFVGSRDSVERDDISSLLADVKNGEIEKVLITRMDRVTASPGLLELLSKTFNQYETKLISLDENIDLTTIDGEFAAMLGVVFARREVKTTRQRIKKGNEYRRSRGIANIQCPLGYTRKDGKYIFDQRPFVCLLGDRPSDTQEFPGRTRVDLAIEIKNLFFETRSLGATAKGICEKYGVQKIGYPSGTAIAKKMSFVLGDSEGVEQIVDHIKKDKGIRAGVFRPSPSGIKKLLLSPVWAGNTPYKNGGEIIYNTHSQIILTTAEQEQVKRILEINFKISGYNKKKEHLFTGLTKCAHCGYPCKAQSVKQTKNGTERRYQCRAYCHMRTCFAKGMIAESKIEDAVINALVKSSEAIAQMIEIESQSQQFSPELIQLKQRLQTVEGLGGEEPEILALKSRIQSQIKKLEQRSHVEDNSKSHLKDLLVSAFSDAIAFKMQTEDTRRSIYLQLIDSIIIEQKEVSGVYKNGKRFTNLVAIIKEVKLRC